MVSRKVDCSWKKKTWEDVVCVDVRYVDKDKTLPEVCVWRRTPSGKSMHIDTDTFPSYFYIPLKDYVFIDTLEPTLAPTSIEYVTRLSIDGEKLIRLNWNRLSKAQFVSVRSHFPKTYESDVKYRLRYHIDNNIKYLIDRRVCFFDIETDMSVDIKNTPAPIISIAVYDTLTKETKQLIVDKQALVKESVTAEERKDKLTVVRFQKETDMLEAFLKFISIYNPDILCAYNLFEFDFPYLINRMKVLDIDYRKMSEIRDVYAIVDSNDKESTKCRCGGRELVDYYLLIKKLYDEDKPDTFKLDDVATKILGTSKTKHGYKNLRELYQQDKELFMTYNIQDVHLLRDLENKTGFILRYMTSLQQLVPIPMESLKDNSVVVDCYILKTFNDQIVFPSKQLIDEDDKSSFKGAITGRFIEDPETGKIRSTDPLKKMYSNVGVFDFSGLYPNIFRTFNISPETIVIAGEPGSVTVDGIGFHQDKMGLLPSLITKIVELRKKYQDILETLSPSDPEYSIYHNLQYAVKRLNNSIYGVTGYKKFRLYNVNVAKSITEAGQMLIKFAYKKLKSLGYDVIYSDTDSCFFVLKCDVNDKTAFELELRFLETFINSEIEKFIYDMGCSKNYLKMDFEKRYAKLIFFGVKKRYIGYADYWKGKWLPKKKLQIKGYDLVRREMSKPIKAAITNILMMFLEDKSKEDIRIYYKEFVSQIKNTPIHELAWSKGIGKGINEYEKVLPQHIKACIVAKQHLGLEFNKNDMPKLMYVKNLPYEHNDKLQYSDVIAFEKDTVLPPTIISKIDYSRFIESFVDNKLDDFLGVDGMDMEYVLNKHNVTLNNFFTIRKDLLGEEEC